MELKKTLYFNMINRIEKFESSSQIYRFLKTVRANLFNLKRPFHLWVNRGKNLECNICNWQGNSFISDRWNQNHICPNCGSHFRHRMVSYALENMEELHYRKLIVGKKILHFAPDPFLGKQLKPKAEIYKTTDLCDPAVDFNTVDVSNMPYFKDNYFDTVIICDVLEHVPDDYAALREIHRILDFGGCAIFTVPQQDHATDSIRDESVTDPRERERTFGYYSHLRLYGTDFEKMLNQAGFRVKVVNHLTIDNPEIVKKHVFVPPVLSPHFYVNNYRNIYFAFKSVPISNG